MKITRYKNKGAIPTKVAQSAMARLEVSYCEITGHTYLTTYPDDQGYMHNVRLSDDELDRLIENRENAKRRTHKYVEVGDRVQDPMDGAVRLVTRITGDSVHFADGGVMAANEITRETRVLLPSEYA